MYKPEPQEPAYGPPCPICCRMERCRVLILEIKASIRNSVDYKREAYLNKPSIIARINRVFNTEFDATRMRHHLKTRGVTANCKRSTPSDETVDRKIAIKHRIVMQNIENKIWNERANILTKNHSRHGWIRNLNNHIALLSKDHIKCPICGCLYGCKHLFNEDTAHNTDIGIMCDLCYNQFELCGSEYFQIKNSNTKKNIYHAAAEIRRKMELADAETL